MILPLEIRVLPMYSSRWRNIAAVWFLLPALPPVVSEIWQFHCLFQKCCRLNLLGHWCLAAASVASNVTWALLNGAWGSPESQDLLLWRGEEEGGGWKARVEGFSALKAEGEAVLFNFCCVKLKR